MSVGQESPGLLNEPGLACDSWCILLLSSSHYLWTVGQTFEFGHHLKESERAAGVQFSGNIGPVSDDVQLWWQGPMTAMHGYLAQERGSLPFISLCEILIYEV